MLDLEDIQTFVEVADAGGVSPIAETAKSLTVFQRTPNFSIPVGNGPMDPAYEKEIKGRLSCAPAS
jgi:hypothetical protein